MKCCGHALAIRSSENWPIFYQLHLKSLGFWCHTHKHIFTCTNRTTQHLMCRLCMQAHTYIHTHTCKHTYAHTHKSNRHQKNVFYACDKGENDYSFVEYWIFGVSLTHLYSFLCTIFHSNVQLPHSNKCKLQEMAKNISNCHMTWVT